MSICEVTGKTDFSEVASLPSEQDQDSICREIPAILAKHRGGRAEIIAVLEDIQARFGYLPEKALRMVSERTGRSLVDIYGMATFYRLFSLEPRGKHLICACMGTACHVRGAAGVVDELEKQLGIAAGETTSDGQFSLETANCLGACALGPIVVVDGRYFSKVRRRKVRALLDSVEQGFLPTEVERALFPVQVSCPHCNHSLMDSQYDIDNRPSIRVSVLADGRQGRLRLSSLFGSYQIASDWEIPRQSVPRFFCPHCHEELVNGSLCPVCEAPLVPLIVLGGGTIQFCSRRGCEKHLLDLI
ncbi:MAG: NAD(P)H-dependent oxidoreductase subunit E [Planctomycetes bacterium]|nr:NAD(P)H-dependent oxidoreductase subunit E [Planctomycetota bacterium]MBU4400646.1 NAD(P)H-dependent oxidoreductase subunit E [Planctomycetota bacterium]MCG2683584.1 NAD(P)H-dependent oxidoreductase subunit E [Planctomycetales bacterium]